MSASAASLNNSESLAPEIVGQKVEALTSFLDHTIRFIAGVNPNLRELSESEKTNLHSPQDISIEEKPELKSEPVIRKGFRYNLARIFYNITKNGKWAKVPTGIFEAIYAAGALVGSPMRSMVDKARKSEQALSMLRRFGTGLDLNSFGKIFGAVLGLPALFAKSGNIFLLNGLQSWLGNASEDALPYKEKKDHMQIS